MFDTLVSKVKFDKDLPARAKNLAVLQMVLDGSIYDVLTHEFQNEKNGAGEYIPLRERKPSVRYNLCGMVVDDTVSFLFGEGRWPAVQSENRDFNAALAELIDESDLAGAMQAAAHIGSVGSVAVVMKILKGRPFWSAMPTGLLTPEFDAEEPDCLIRLTERYKVDGQTLRGMGYQIAETEISSSFWWQRVWDADAETWFLPQSLDDASKGKDPVADPTKTLTHNLGFCPAVWIKNLPVSSDDWDGHCTFRRAIDTSIEIDYQLSQAGRGLKYSSDPLLLIKEPVAAGDDIVRSAGNALITGAEGDAKLLEINGAASAAVIEYVRTLREMALETIHGNRANAYRISAAQSGRAMELLYAPLINLVDKLRATYGRGLLRLCQMLVKAGQKIELKAYGKAVPKLDPSLRLTLRWPLYFVPTDHDRQSEANTLRSLREAGLISQETAVAQTCGTWDVNDATEELARIKADEAAADQRAAMQGAQIKDQQQLPA